MPLRAPDSSRLRGRRRLAMLVAVALVATLAAACEPDTTPPQWNPGAPEPVVTKVGPHLLIDWPEATGDPVRYQVQLLDGTVLPMQTPTASRCLVVGLTRGYSYIFRITAYDAAGNWSGDLPVVGSHDAGNQWIMGRSTTAPGAGGGPTKKCVSTTDTDGDRLPDALETGTGTFAHAAATGTSPTVADSDGDGIDDGDEALGTTQGLDLHGLGARPVQRDILVEMDWLTGFTPARANCTTWPDLQPTASQLQHAIDLYADLPISTPLGGDGINLIVDRGQGGVFTGGTAIPDDDGRLSMYDASAAHLAAERAGYFHHVTVVVDFYVFLSGFHTGGLAPRPGTVLTIGRGCGSGLSDWSTGAVLAHELGHNLNLHHGGHDAVNGKPNYNSIMNYDYAYGIDLDCDGVGDRAPAVRRLGFSTTVRPSIDEHAVREQKGACGDVPADLDGDGVIETAPYAADISGNGTLEVLAGSNDLEHIDLSLSLTRNRSGLPEGEEVFDPFT